MPFYLYDVKLQRVVESDTLRAKNKLMKILTVRGVNFDPGTNVLRDELIVKDRNVRQRGRPIAVLKHVRLAICLNNDVRVVSSAEPLAFRNEIEITGSQ